MIKMQNKKKKPHQNTLQMRIGNKESPLQFILNGDKNIQISFNPQHAKKGKFDEEIWIPPPAKSTRRIRDCCSQKRISDEITLSLPQEGKFILHNGLPLVIESSHQGNFKAAIYPEKNEKGPIFEDKGSLDSVDQYTRKIKESFEKQFTVLKESEKMLKEHETKKNILTKYVNSLKRNMEHIRQSIKEIDLFDIDPNSDHGVELRKSTLTKSVSQKSSTSGLTGERSEKSLPLATKSKDQVHVKPTVIQIPADKLERMLTSQGQQEKYQDLVDSNYQALQGKNVCENAMIKLADSVRKSKILLDKTLEQGQSVGSLQRKYIQGVEDLYGDQQNLLDAIYCNWDECSSNDLVDDGVYVDGLGSKVAEIKDLEYEDSEEEERREIPISDTGLKRFKLNSEPILSHHKQVLSLAQQLTLTNFELEKVKKELDLAQRINLSKAINQKSLKNKKGADVDKHSNGHEEGNTIQNYYLSENKIQKGNTPQTTVTHKVTLDASTKKGEYDDEPLASSLDADRVTNELKQTVDRTMPTIPVDDKSNKPAEIHAQHQAQSVRENDKSGITEHTGSSSLPTLEQETISSLSQYYVSSAPSSNEGKNIRKSSKSMSPPRHSRTEDRHSPRWEGTFEDQCQVKTQKAKVVSESKTARKKLERSPKTEVKILQREIPIEDNIERIKIPDKDDIPRKKITNDDIQRKNTIQDDFQKNKTTDDIQRRNALAQDDIQRRKVMEVPAHQKDKISVKRQKDKKLKPTGTKKEIIKQKSKEKSSLISLSYKGSSGFEVYSDLKDHEPKNKEKEQTEDMAEQIKQRKRFSSDLPDFENVLESTRLSKSGKEGEIASQSSDSLNDRKSSSSLQSGFEEETLSSLSNYYGSSGSSSNEGQKIRKGSKKRSKSKSMPKHSRNEDSSLPSLEEGTISDLSQYYLSSGESNEESQSKMGVTERPKAKSSSGTVSKHKANKNSMNEYTHLERSGSDQFHPLTPLSYDISTPRSSYFKDMHDGRMSTQLHASYSRDRLSRKAKNRENDLGSNQFYNLTPLSYDVSSPEMSKLENTPRKRNEATKSGTNENLQLRKEYDTYGNRSKHRNSEDLPKRGSLRKAKNRENDSDSNQFYNFTPLSYDVSSPEMSKLESAPRKQLLRESNEVNKSGTNENVQLRKEYDTYSNRSKHRHSEDLLKRGASKSIPNYKTSDRERRRLHKTDRIFYQKFPESERSKRRLSYSDNTDGNQSNFESRNEYYSKLMPQHLEFDKNPAFSKAHKSQNQPITNKLSSDERKGSVLRRSNNTPAEKNTYYQPGNNIMQNTQSTPSNLHENAFTEFKNEMLSPKNIESYEDQSNRKPTYEDYHKRRPAYAASIIESTHHNINNSPTRNQELNDSGSVNSYPGTLVSGYLSNDSISENSYKNSLVPTKSNSSPSNYQQYRQNQNSSHHSQKNQKYNFAPTSRLQENTSSVYTNVGQRLGHNYPTNRNAEGQNTIDIQRKNENHDEDGMTRLKQKAANYYNMRSPTSSGRSFTSSHKNYKIPLELTGLAGHSSQSTDLQLRENIQNSSVQDLNREKINTLYEKIMKYNKRE